MFLTVMVFMAFMSVSLLGQSDDYAQGGGDPPGRVARLGFISGGVSFQASGEDQWNQALSNYPLTTGDRIYTDRDGRAEVETGNIAVRLSSDTDVSTTNLSDQLVQLGLAQGTLRVRAYDILSGNSVEIDTPNAALTLLRPGSYRVETYPDDNTTLVTVNSGDLEISGNGLSQVVHSGQSVKLSGSDEVQLDWLSAPGSDDFDRWCGDRDRRYLSSNSRQYVGSYVPGYSDLDDYGRWEPADEYGEVWYPSSVPVGWAPYRYGRWAWVEPWGWTWVEEEPWGFAPFHYGRWALIGTRWGWVPGPVVVGIRPIYAPALVAFVGGPDANVQVWFPLGPRDPFFPWYHHSDGYLRQVNVTNVRVVNIVNVINVRNVNNIHYAYQRVAPTAVSTAAFRGSRPVSREIVRVDVSQIARERVIPHPDIQPDVQAVHAGLPQTHPRVEQTRPRIESRTPVVNGNRNGPPQNNDRGGVQDRGRTNDVAHNPPANGQNPPAADNRRTFPGRDNPSPANNRDENDNRNAAGGPPPNNNNVGAVGNNRDDNRGRNATGGPPPNNNSVQGSNGNESRGRNVSGGPPQERRPLVTKAPPPPQNPPFAQRQPTLQEHPGRPLEPQQVDNIRRGQPAGQMHDREFPPHRDASPPPSRGPAPPPKQDNRGKDRQHN